jgi:hypothetical protein
VEGGPFISCGELKWAWFPAGFHEKERSFFEGGKRFLEMKLFLILSQKSI